MGKLEDLHEAQKRMNEIRMTLENHPRPLGNTLIVYNFRETLKRLQAVYETPPLAEFDSISATFSDLASQGTNDPNNIDHAILLAENVVATIPPGHAMQATCFDKLATMLSTRYMRIRNLGDLQNGIRSLELAMVATPLHHPDRASRFNNLSARLWSRFERTGDFDDL